MIKITWIFDDRDLISYEEGFKNMLKTHNDEEIEKLIKEWENILKSEPYDENRYRYKISMAADYLNGIK